MIIMMMMIVLDSYKKDHVELPTKGKHMLQQRGLATEQDVFYR